MPGDSKRYSVDNYDKLNPGDFVKIFDAFTDLHSCRLKIIRFLAKESKEEEHAKTRKQIARELDITEQATLEHLDALEGIGIIVQIRSEDDDNNKVRFQGPRKIIKYYLNLKNLIELSSILNAAMLGLPKDAANKIKKGITRIFEQSGDKLTYGIYASRFLDIQGQILDAIRDVAYTYNEAQKDIVNWWCEVAESNVRHYYYPWLYSPDFTSMASKAYRSMADYAISGLNIAQNNFDAYIDMSKNYSQLIADNINEMSRTGVTSSNMFEPKPASLLTSSTETTPTILPNVEYGDDESRLYGWRKLRDELIEIVQIARKRT